MAKNQKRLTFEDRETIEKLLKEGRNGRQISDVLKRSKSTIYYEINKFENNQQYSATAAQEVVAINTKEKNRKQWSFFERVDRLEKHLENLMWRVQWNIDQLNKFIKEGPNGGLKMENMNSDEERNA